MSLPPELFDNASWAKEEAKPYMKEDSMGNSRWVVPQKGRPSNVSRGYTGPEPPARTIEPKKGARRHRKSKKTAGRRKSKKAGRRTRKH